MNRVETEIKDNIEILNSNNDHFEAYVSFPEEFTGFEGHFPDNPILPGICIVKALVAALEKLIVRNCLLKEMSTVKFYLPVLPGSCLKYDTQFERNMSKSGIILKSKVTCNDKRTAQIKLLVEVKG